MKRAGLYLSVLNISASTFRWLSWILQTTTYLPGMVIMAAGFRCILLPHFVAKRDHARFVRLRFYKVQGDVFVEPLKE